MEQLQQLLEQFEQPPPHSRQGPPNLQRRQMEQLLHQLHSQLPEAGVAGAMGRAAGADLFEGRLAKCATVPPEQRSADEAAFLAGHALLEEAAAVLVPLVAEGVQPAEQARIAALLKWVSGQLGLEPGQPFGLFHAQISNPAFEKLMMRPLLEVRAAGAALVARQSPELHALLAGGQPVRSLEQVVQLIMLVCMSLGEASIPMLRSMCDTLSHSLRDPGSQAELEAQLAAVQRHMAAEGSARRVPSLATLRAAATLVQWNVCITDQCIRP